MVTDAVTWYRVASSLRPVTPIVVALGSASRVWPQAITRPAVDRLFRLHPVRVQRAVSQR